MDTQKPKEVVYKPTPAEIRAECERFRAGWSETERRKRARHLHIPALAFAEVSERDFHGADAA